eukprot:3887999-Pyramimonas_sp.AAC.1
MGGPGPWNVALCISHHPVAARVGSLSAKDDCKTVLVKQETRVSSHTGYSTPAIHISVTGRARRHNWSRSANKAARIISARTSRHGRA